MSKKRKNQDADLDTFEELDAKDILDDEEDSDVPLTVELDDAYASEYFQKYESDPNYARNASMPDGSPKSSNALRQHCKERGLKYIRHNGTEQPARQIKEACTCRKLCYMKFMDDVRRKLLANLLGLSANGQFIFLSSHIERVAVQRPRFKYFPRKSVRIYYLPYNSGRIQVCMRMFANTYDITDKRLRLLNEKIHIGSYGEIVNKFTTNPSDNVVAAQPSVSDYQEEAEQEEDMEPEDSNGSMDFIEIPLIRDLGNMEEYFKRYETDVNFHSRMEDLIHSSKYKKQTAKQMLAERQYKKAKGYRYIRLDGTVVPERKLKPECSCRSLCNLKISNNARQVLLNNLLNMSNEGQENFIYSHLILKPQSLHRNFIYHYLPTISERIKVCKKMFLNTFDLSNKRVRVIIVKKRKEVLGVKEEDPEQNPTQMELITCEEEDDYEDDTTFEADDEIEIEYSNPIKVEFEDDSNESNIDDEELVSSSKETIESPEGLNRNVLSNVEPESALDDAFLDQYFHRYRTNFGQEEPKDKNTRLKKKWVHSEEDTSFHPCSCVAYGCSRWFTKDLHEKIYSRFCKLSALNKKRFLYRLITKENKRRSKKCQSRRNFSMFYFLPTKKGNIKVCKVMFMNTFKVTDRNLRSIIGCKKFAEPSEEVTFVEESTFTKEEPANEIDDDDSLVEEIHYGADRKQTGENTGSETDSVVSSQLPFYTGENLHSNKGSVEAVEIETSDEIEISYSDELIKQELEEADYENAIDEELVNNEQSDCMLQTISQLEEENDDIFLDQYFHLYVTNFGKEEPTNRKNRSTGKWWPLNDVNETPLEPCSCVTFNCSSWFTDDLRQKLFSRYARLSPWNKKRFLYRHIRREQKKRGKKCLSRRNFSMFYFVPTKKGFVKVCKVMFMSTFKVSDKKLRTIVCSEKLADPMEETSKEDLTCIKLDPDDFLIDFDENFLGEASNSMQSYSEANKTGHLLFEQDPESCFTNKCSNITENSTESCEEDDKLPTHGIDNKVTAPVPGSKQQLVVELDDNFLREYFSRYETNIEESEPPSSKPRKVWIKHDTSSKLLPPCSCQKKCYAVYKNDVRREIYTRFTKLSTSNQKRFLFRHIKLDNPQKRSSTTSRRQKSWFYYLPAKTGHVKVCKVMFLNTFRVTEKKLRNLVKRKQFANQACDGEDDDRFSGSPSDDLNKQLNCRTTTTAANQIYELSTDAYSEYGNYFTEVAESAVEPLLSILGCGTVNRQNDSSNVAEVDEIFLDEYFHNFGRNVAGETLRTISGSLGNILSASKILSPIACACSKMCHTTFSDKVRQAILDRYAELSVENQIYFLASHVKKTTALLSPDEPSLQPYPCIYYLPSKSGPLRVCNVMFLNTFNINENELREFIFCEAGPSHDSGNLKNVYQRTEIKTEPDLPMNIKIENESGSEDSTEIIVGDYDHDQRNDHSNPLSQLEDDQSMAGTSRQNGINSNQPRKVNNVAISFAKKHVCSFPRITSHFCRVANKTKYISCFLDVTSMYIAYIKSCTESSEEPVPSKIYSAILQNERAKDPVLPSSCDVCQHKEGLDPEEDKFWYEDADAQEYESE